MSRCRVVVMRGDGIGGPVIDETLRVLDAAGLDAELIDAEIGWSCWRRDGDPLPQRTLDLLETHRLGLLGAVTSKGAVAAEAELPKELRGTGRVYRSPLLTLRQHLALDVCMRPCTTFPGNPRNFMRRAVNGTAEEPAIDVVLFRQNTQDLYAGVEWLGPPPAVRTALATHPRFAPFAALPGKDLAIALRVITRDASRRIVEAAFRRAEATGREEVVLAEKPNVLRDTSGLVEEAALEVADRHPGVRLRSMNVDAVALELSRRPETFGVIVTTNVFGDILSDQIAGLTGGLGFACSANLGVCAAIFEPTHGSAPRHDGIEPPIANPIAATLAGALLAEHAGQSEVAVRVRAAVASVVAEGQVRTYDMAGREGAASTRAMGDAIRARL